VKKHVGIVVLESPDAVTDCRGAKNRDRCPRSTQHRELRRESIRVSAPGANMRHVRLCEDALARD